MCKPGAAHLPPQLNARARALPPLLPRPPRSPSAAEVFCCAEESLFYSQALEKLLPMAVGRAQERGLLGGAGPGGFTAVEFGTGDGTPVLSALIETQ